MSAAARIRDDQVVAVEAVLCLPRFLRLCGQTGPAQSMPCRQAADFLGGLCLFQDGRNITTGKGRQKPSPCQGEPQPSAAGRFVSAALPKSKKGKKNEKQPRKHRQSERQATRVPISLGSGRHGTILTKHSLQTGQPQIPISSPSPARPTTNPNSEIILPLGDGPHRNRRRPVHLNRRLSTRNPHTLYPLSPIPSGVIRRRPAAAAASRLKPTFCFRRRRRARGGGSECDEYPPPPSKPSVVVTAKRNSGSQGRSSSGFSPLSNEL